MARTGFVAVLLGSTLSLTSYSHDSTEMKADKCIPENNLWIPSFVERQGVTEAEFNEVIDRVEKIYSPVVQEMGGELVIKRLWENGTVNAGAYRVQNKFMVEMYGGLARHRVMTKDGLALVVCHEVGHHIGGAPKIGTRWTTNEGQSDYFASLKCLRKVFALDDNQSVLQNLVVDPVLERECAKSFKESQNIEICIRSTVAGLAAVAMFNSIKKTAKAPAVDTPDKNEVERTFHGHPAPQCRLDTYFAGAICTANLKVDVSATDLDIGVCSRRFGETRGVRPLCWFSEVNPSGITVR